MAQETVAQLAELDRKHISTIETGKSEPGTWTLTCIAGARDIPVEELVTGLVFMPSEHSTGHLELPAT